LRQDFEPSGYEVSFVDLGDLDSVRRAIGGAGLVLAETITNPPCAVPDLEAGVAAGGAAAIGAARARSVRTGTTLGPFDAWLALRGLRTLDVRMRRHSDNSLALARAMQTMAGVARVHHPLLEDSASYEVARRLLPD